LFYRSKNGSYNKGTGSAVNLQFTHKLVKLVFNITKGDGVESLNNLTVKITEQQTGATLDLTDGSMTSSSNKSEITANTVSDGTSSEVIVLPNSSVSGIKFTFTTAGTGAGTYEVAVPTPTNSKWESGKKYTYTVTLKRNEVSITGSVSGWDAGSDHSIESVPQ
jgi:hypothetical protein